MSYLIINVIMSETKITSQENNIHKLQSKERRLIASYVEECLRWSIMAPNNYLKCMLSAGIQLNIYLLKSAISSYSNVSRFVLEVSGFMFHHCSSSSIKPVKNAKPALTAKHRLPLYVCIIVQNVHIYNIYNYSQQIIAIKPPPQ